MNLLRALFGPLWRWPLLLAVLSIVGLVSALLADGLWDTLSWLTLALPVAVAAGFGLRRRLPASSDTGRGGAAGMKHRA